MTKADVAWTPDLTGATGPLYLVLADAIARDLASGALPPGARLPPQRRLAKVLGVDFTTVSRAYAEAARRGLVEGRVGQGTYARGGPESPVPAPVDLTMNLPPHFAAPALTARMWDDISSLKAGGLDLLLRYQDPAGAAADREAAALWMAPVAPDLDPDRILVVPGAQSALFALTTLLARPGEAVAVERLTFPGYRAAAAQARVRLIDLEMDAEGLRPEAFEAACRSEPPRLLYCTPTLHNPTTATMGLARRQAIVEIARRHGVAIIEDDAYGRLPARPLPPLCALAPEIVWHVASLSKALSPGLRVAHLVAPSPRMAAQARGALRATVSMASPLTAAIATRWISSGCAQAALDAIRQETAARRALSAGLAPHAVAAAEAFHVWLNLPAGWSRGEFAARLSASGVGVVVSDAFHVGPSPPPEAVRLGLGGPISRVRLGAALDRISDLLATAPALSSSVV